MMTVFQNKGFLTLVASTTLLSSSNVVRAHVTLQDLSSNLGERAYGLCQGGCDQDTDCQFGLSCFNRSESGIEPIPGCYGVGSPGNNYCYIAPEGSLIIAGDEGIPIEAFPLSECEGDCNDDNDCLGDLICVQRSGIEPVNGCNGSGQSGKAYCAQAMPSASPSSTPSENPSSFPTKTVSAAPSTVPSEPPSGSPTNTITSAPTSVPSSAPSGSPTKNITPAPTAPLFLSFLGNNGNPSRVYPLPECGGDCDDDDECDGDLKCFQRRGEQPVPGCVGVGESGLDYCYAHYTGYGRLSIEGNNGSPSAAFPLQACQGDCDSDNDCAPGLHCYQRGASTLFVPGCDGIPVGRNDYCINVNVPVKVTEPTDAPITPPTDAPVVSPTDSPVETPLPFVQMVGDNGTPAQVYPLNECQGDCDGDSDCGPGLLCFDRNNLEPVPGCIGDGTSGKDYCYKESPPDGTLVEVGNNGEPASVFPLQVCQGDCDSDSECAPGLFCHQRSDSETVPGCSGSGRDGVDFCYDPKLGDIPDAPTWAPITSTPTLPGTTYKPGEATVLEEGLLLSTGLTARKIAIKNQKVQYANGSRSTEDFHTAPDGGAVFEDSVTGEYVYVSNSESSSDGGVGSIRFNSQGDVIGYQRLLFRDPATGRVSKDRTARNCGGGKTYWGTWVTCEEVSSGQVWEVDPWGNEPGRQTKLGGAGRAYESAAYDNRNPLNPIFYVTTDETDGPLVKYTPSSAVTQSAVSSGDYSQLLHSDGGLLEYFKVTSITANPDGSTTGTYTWTTSLAEGDASAAQHHVQGEGIDIRDGKMYYTTKADKYLFIIDLDDGTFSRSSTVSGAFDSQPDQVARVLDFTSGETDGILYFCEDGGDECGVHGRDARGRFFTILQDATGAFSGETTGLAFSPNGKFMYVSFQSPGIIFEISRTDGQPFYGGRLDIKYHADGDNTNAFRQLYEDNTKTCEFNTEMCSV